MAQFNTLITTVTIHGDPPFAKKKATTIAPCCLLHLKIHQINDAIISGK